MQFAKKKTGSIITHSGLINLHRKILLIHCKGRNLICNANAGKINLLLPRELTNLKVNILVFTQMELS